MAENISVNGVTYNGVDSVEFETPDGKSVGFYPDAVRYNAQELTDEQRAQARENIGAKSGVFVPEVDNEGNLEWSYVDGSEPIDIPVVNIKGPAGANGSNGYNGWTYVPSVDENGDISWGLRQYGGERPELIPVVNIRGPKGDTGKVEVLTEDPPAEELYEGKMWIVYVPDLTKLSAPVISLAGTTDTTATITLNNPSYDTSGNAIESYNIYLDGVLVETVTLEAGENYTYTGLTQGTTYALTICGVSGSNMSADSNSVTIEQDAKVNFVILVGCSAATNSDGSPKINTGNAIRAVVVQNSGTHFIRQVDGYGDCYAIDVPPNATKVTVECTGMHYGFNGWTYIDGVWKYAVDSGWKNSGTTFDLTAGQLYCAIIGLKRTDGGNVTSDDVANITVAFS